MSSEATKLSQITIGHDMEKQFLSNGKANEEHKGRNQKIKERTAHINT